jgi:hypothetical protein
MADDILSRAKAEFEALERRVSASAEIGWMGLKGLTWDVITKGKQPTQVYKEIQDKAKDFELKEQEYRRRQRK